MKKYSPIVVYFASMIRHTTLFLLLATIISGVSAQVPLDENRYSDSLSNVLKQATADSVKTKASYLLSYYWVFRDPAKAREYLDQGRQYAKSNPFQLAISWFYEGIIFLCQRRYPQKRSRLFKGRYPP
ncbi:hypothetical protein [Paraflavitalea speifideaquila]|uniref:hypothetical protein n=1 Tax=Paraflavitalea speifideaquila TaxID=3076558 RepID=UPI0028EE9851|nr:hypothetical protein [Paraflavitalea speifideiaquila]